MNDTGLGQAERTFPILDLDAALEHTGGDRELLQQLCYVFAEECPKQLEEVRVAVVSKIPSSVQRAAHKIKGSTSVVGGTRASQAALQLEKAAGSGDLQCIQHAFDELNEAIQTLQARVMELAESEALS